MVAFEVNGSAWAQESAKLALWYRNTQTIRTFALSHAASARPMAPRESCFTQACDDSRWIKRLCNTANNLHHPKVLELRLCSADMHPFISRWLSSIRRDTAISTSVAGESNCFSALAANAVRLDLAEKSDMNTCIRVPCSTHVKVESQLNFWWDSSCSVEAFTRVPRLESFPKDLFLDTTYCSPRWKFVPQTVACDCLSQITSKELQREPKTLFVVTWLCGLRLSCAAADAAFWIVLGRLWQGRCSKLILIICWERPEVAGYHAAMHLFLCPGSLHVSLAASLLSRISKVGHAGSRQRILLRYLMDILHYK